ncbi:MAG: hypothetical protein JSV05_09795 [Candidatus Bathyarchaeota archaeon]|nr:MAG: hypothetical protein JSV05_09795 [Candidatus Bathyarchaeota archaeon]
MKPKIALATISGKIYYLLVNELKRRDLPFMSLIPSDRIPLDVEVVITSNKERCKIIHHNVLEYDENAKPVEIIDEAMRIIRGNKSFDRLIIGVDPGENFGVAILGDGELLETGNCSSAAETMKKIEETLRRYSSTNAAIRIGNGAAPYSRELWNRLGMRTSISQNVVFESVEEEGTSQYLGQTSRRRAKIDVSSAIEIAQRQGRVIKRGKRKNLWESKLSTPSSSNE